MAASIAVSFRVCLLRQGPDGRPLMLGPGRRLYSSDSPSHNTSTPKGRKSASPGVAVATAAAVAGSVASFIYTRARGTPAGSQAPTWSVAKEGTEPVALTKSRTPAEQVSKVGGPG